MFSSFTSASLLPRCVIAQLCSDLALLNNKVSRALESDMSDTDRAYRTRCEANQVHLKPSLHAHCKVGLFRLVRAWVNLRCALQGRPFRTHLRMGGMHACRFRFCRPALTHTKRNYAVIRNRIRPNKQRGSDAWP